MSNAPLKSDILFLAHSYITTLPHNSGKSKFWKCPMAREKKEDWKSIKLSASTHARLVLMSNILECSISDVIDELMRVAYPELLDETDQMLERMEDIRKSIESKRKKL